MDTNMQVCMANTRKFDFDKHLIGFRFWDRNLLILEWSPAFLKDLCPLFFRDCSFSCHFSFAAEGTAGLRTGDG